MELPALPLGSRRDEDIALDLMKFIAMTTGYGKTSGAGVGFQGKRCGRQARGIRRPSTGTVRALFAVGRGKVEKSGHRVIGSSGDRESKALEFKVLDHPMTRWPDHPISLFLNLFVDKGLAAGLF